MLVVADSSPLIVLVTIDRLDLLVHLFREVIIPPEVAKELEHPNRDRPTSGFATHFSMNDFAPSASAQTATHRA
jgi:predicted nucleic acid-binding protein